VGLLLLKNPQAFGVSPVSQLAKDANVSKPTVIRFCHSLGYQGLSQFKLKLAASLGGGVPFIHQNIAATDDVAGVFTKLIDNTVTALLKYRNQASTLEIEKACKAIVKAHCSGNRLEFYGVGNSGIVAQDAQHKFFRLGIHTACHSDGHLQIMSASLLKADDCLVIISNSGRTRDLLDACSIAKKQGCTTIAITASASPLSGMADIAVPADHPESYEQFSPMVSRLLHLTILDILATSVALQIGIEQLQPGLRKMKSNLLQKRYL